MPKLPEIFVIADKGLVAYPFRSVLLINTAFPPPPLPIPCLVKFYRWLPLVLPNSIKDCTACEMVSLGGGRGCCIISFTLKDSGRGSECKRRWLAACEELEHRARSYCYNKAEFTWLFQALCLCSLKGREGRSIYWVRPLIYLARSINTNKPPFVSTSVGRPSKP